MFFVRTDISKYALSTAVTCASVDSDTPGIFGTQSKYYGDVQRERQRWLVERAEELRSSTDKSNDVDGHGDDKNKTSRSLREDEDMGEATVERHVRRVVDEGAAAGVYGVPEALTGFYGEEEGGQGIGKWERVGGKGGTVNNAGVVRNGTVSKYQRELIGQDEDNSEKEVYEGGWGEPAARSAMGEVVVVFPAPRESDGAMGETNGRRRLFLGSGRRGISKGTLEERIARLEVGAELWGATYVPPIEPTRRQELVDKWSSAGVSAKVVETGDEEPRVDLRSAEWVSALRCEDFCYYMSGLIPSPHISPA